MTLKGNVTLLLLIAAFVVCATAAYCQTRDVFAAMNGGLK